MGKLEKDFGITLTRSWRRPLSYRNKSIDLLCKSMDWFLYDNSLRHERVKQETLCVVIIAMICSNLASLLKFQFFRGSTYNLVKHLWWSFHCKDSKLLNILTKKLHCRCLLWVLNTTLFFEDSSNVLFL